MSNITRLLVAGSLAAAFISACGSECTSGATECVSDGLIRTCVPSDDGNQWLVSQCSPNTTCLTNPSLRLPEFDENDDAGVNAHPSETRPSMQPACVGTCSVGAHECVNDAIARYCVSGGVWQIDACSVGEKCVKGRCSIGQGTGSVQACTPGAKACANARVAKVCDADGSSWVELPCAANETCLKDTCAPDPKSSCDDGGSCLDNKTAIRCLGQADGYKLEMCTGDLYCEGGRCRGAACAIGSMCIGSNQLRECVDGKSLKDTQCAVNEVCKQDKDVASCSPLQCTPGTSACGDPRDSKVDPKKYFTACVTGAGSGIPEWVTGECTGAATCDPSRANSGNPCSQVCSKGAQSCAQDPLTGVNDGISTCGDDGKWAPAKTCNPGTDTRRVCMIQMNPDATQLPKALCAEPICQWIATNPGVGATGACESEKLRKCNPDGSLADANACEHGVCRTLRSTVTSDGRSPGACDNMPECQDGEELCVIADGNATPRYRSCANGYWGSELKTCDNDAACYTRKDDQGKRHALCGAQCSPGSKRCNGSNEVEVCDDSGHYGGGMKCSAGSCKAEGNSDAACVLECMPGSHVCAGSAAIAADNYHAGTTQEIVCGADGKRGAAKNCPDGTLCRMTGSSLTLGCVQCIGPTAAGGNDEGTADSRCDPNDNKKVQECTDDNKWASGRMCAGTKSCVSPGSGTCGTCMAESGATVTCTQTNLDADMSGVTCQSKSYGDPVQWGGLSDCCSNYKQGAGTGGSVAYCK
jgi:hypothetical protein